MDTNDVSPVLKSSFDWLIGEAERCFGWSPSPYFRNRLIIFARMVGSTDVDDLMALVLCEASEAHMLLREGTFFHAAFSTTWGLSRVRETLAESTSKPTRAMTSQDALKELEQRSEDELAERFARLLERNPEWRKSRIAMSPTEILWEDTILRALDRERQRWRREAERSKQMLIRNTPSYRYTDDPSQRMVMEEKIRAILQHVESDFDQDDQALFKARFEQGLDYKQIAAILGLENSETALATLRKRAARMKHSIRLASL